MGSADIYHNEVGMDKNHFTKIYKLKNTFRKS